MKKFFVSLVILIILSGVVFWFGWVQLVIPPGSVAVFQSKTSGMRPLVIESGQFVWAWQRLIPKNTRIYIFNISTHDKEILVQESLPSADIYSSILNTTSNFSYSIKGRLSVLMNASVLPELVKSGIVQDQSTLLAWQIRRIEEMSDFIIQKLQYYSHDADGLTPFLFSGVNDELQKELEITFQDFKKIDCYISSVSFPDYELYETAKSVYSSYVQNRELLMQKELEELIKKSSTARIRLEELEILGGLLDKYPILLKYFALGASGKEELDEILSVVGE